MGRDRYVEDFRRSFWKSPFSVKEQVLGWVKSSLIIGGLVGLLLLLPGGYRLALGLIVPAILLTARYFFSIHMAFRRFDKWADHLVKKHALNVAQHDQHI